MEEERTIVAWQAARHQWGPGKIHEIEIPPAGTWIQTPKGEAFRINEDFVPQNYKWVLQRFLCGRFLEGTPGNFVWKLPRSKVTCGGCRNKVLSEARKAVQEAEWAVRNEQYRREREVENLAWRQKYEAHLESDKWHMIRRRVFARSRGDCEGCGLRKATQVHHLTYTRLGDEMLFDLVAICDECHEKIHGSD